MARPERVHFCAGRVGDGLRHIARAEIDLEHGFDLFALRLADQIADRRRVRFGFGRAAGKSSGKRIAVFLLQI